MVIPKTRTHFKTTFPKQFASQSPQPYSHPRPFLANFPSTNLGKKMKKFLIPLVLTTLCCASANAQDSTSNSAPKGGVSTQERGSNSSDQRAKMEQHRALMEKLTPEQKKAVKAEMERHRAAMKQITGVDLPMPPMPPMEGGAQR